MTQTVETSELTDGVLLKRLSAGDKAAWDTLVRRHADTVFSVVSRIVRRQSDAEDAGQEAFLRLKEYAHTFDAARYGDHARSWIATIACREALKINSRRAAAKDVPYDDEMGGGPANPESQGNAKVEEREIHSLLRTAVEALPQRQREAIVMHFAAGLTQTEIATELGCDQSTISDRIRQGLDKLRQRLGSADVAMALAPATLAASLLEQAPPAFVSGLINHSVWAPAAVAGAKAGAAGITGVSTAKAALWIVGAIAALSLSFAALKNFGVDRGLAASQLGSFEDNTLQGWEPGDKSKLSVVEEHAGDGKRALRIDMDASQFPGARKKFERAVDWRSYRALRATIFSGAARPLDLSVRIDDEKSTGFGTRFNFDSGFHLAPGSNEVEIPIGYLWNGSLLSRGLNVDKISELRFFLNGAAEPATLWLDNIRLVPLKADAPDVVDLLQANSHLDPVGESTFKRDGALLSVSMPAGQKFTGFELFALNDWLPYDELTVELNENGPPLPGGISIKVADDSGRHSTLNTRSIGPDGKLHLPVELFGQIALGRVKTVSLFCDTLNQPQTIEVRHMQLLRRPLKVAPSRHAPAVEGDPLSLDFAPVRGFVRANSFQAVIWIPQTDGSVRAVHCNSEGAGVSSYSVPAEDLKNLDTTQRIRVWSFFLDHGVWFWKYIEAKKNPDGPLKISYDSLDGWTSK